MQHGAIRVGTGIYPPACPRTRSHAYLDHCLQSTPVPIPSANRRLPPRAIGGWRLAVSGGWRLAVGGWWQFVVGGWWSLGAVLQGGPQQKKKKSGFLTTSSARQS